MIHLYAEINMKTDKQESTHRYVFLAPGAEELYWSYIACGVKEADEAGDSYTLLEQYGMESNVGSCMESAILADVDGIIMKSSRNADEQMKLAEQADIPVIFYDGDIAGSNRSCYIGTDNYKIGQKAAEILKENLNEDLKEKGKILVITRKKDAISQIERVRALEENLHEMQETDIVYLEDEGDKIILKEKLHQILTEELNIDGIVIMEEEASNTLPELLHQEGMDKETFIISMEFTNETVEYLRSGAYDVVLMQQLEKIGYQAVRWLEEYIENKEKNRKNEQSDVINLESIVLTRENLDDVIGGYDIENLEWNIYR